MYIILIKGLGSMRRVLEVMVQFFEIFRVNLLGHLLLILISLVRL